MNQECDMEKCTQKDEIKQIKDKVDIVCSAVQKIEIALLGNEFTDNIGFIKRQIDLEKKVKSLQFKMIYYSGTGAGFGFFIGYIINRVLKMIQ